MATAKQKKALEIMAENGGIVSRAMLEAGYRPETAKVPQKLTTSKGFKELCEQYLPDNLLIKIHKEGLKATKKSPHLVDRDEKGRPIYEYVKEDDFSTRHKYLDTAYKIKGVLKEGPQINIVNISSVLSEIENNNYDGQKTAGQSLEAEEPLQDKE